MGLMLDVSLLAKANMKLVIKPISSYSMLHFIVQLILNKGSKKEQVL